MSKIEYDDQYPTCDRTDVELRIYPGDRDPDWVTAVLGIRATSVNRKGERHTSAIGRVRTTPKNGWFLSSAGKVASKDARRHLDWLLDALEPAQEQLRSLVEDDGIRVSVICVWWSASGHGGPILSPAQMSRLADLDLELGFDIYFLPDTDD
jgi:hypothetical protein